MDEAFHPASLPEKVLPLLWKRLKFHLASPLISPYRYRLSRDFQRAQRALSAVRIYIDTNHWIRIRETHRGRENNTEYLHLLQLLRQLTRAGIAVVPVSDQLITELCHQADLQTRKITAAIIDELSDGVTVVGFDRRSVLEMLEWTHASLHKGSPLPLLTVWTTLPNALQSTEYHLSGADPSLSAAFTKAIEDISDTFRLCDLIPSLGTLAFSALNDQAFALSLTTNKEKDPHRPRNFNDLFREEADQYLTAMLPRMPLEVISEMEVLVSRQKTAAADFLEKIKCAFWMQNRAGSLRQALPGLRIIAGCASRIIAEPERRFKHGDQGDIFHACVALPYCNVFLTDSSTRHLTTTKPTDLASLYQCTVLADPREAIDHLQRLIV